jgi:hypothetical protein
MKKALTFMVLLTACGSAPNIHEPHQIPAIPTGNHETWRCTSPSGVIIYVVGVPEPEQVDIESLGVPRAPTVCRLVPLVD